MMYRTHEEIFLQSFFMRVDIISSVCLKKNTMAKKRKAAKKVAKKTAKRKPAKKAAKRRRK